MPSTHREAFSQLQPDMQHLIKRTLAINVTLLRSLAEDRETPVEKAMNAQILDVSLELYQSILAWSAHLPAETVITFIVDLPFEEIPDEVLAGYIPIMQAKINREKAWGEAALKHAEAEANLLKLIDAKSLKALYRKLHNLRDTAHLNREKATPKTDYFQQAFDLLNQRRLEESLPPLPAEALPLWRVERDRGLEMYLATDRSLGLI